MWKNLEQIFNLSLPLSLTKSIKKVSFIVVTKKRIPSKKIKKWIQEYGGLIVTAPLVTGIIFLIRFAGFLEIIELNTLDRFFRWRPLEPTDGRIVIVGINESDIRKIGQWPAPDEKFAELLEKIKAQKPRAIGMDIYRDLKVEPGNDRLVEVYKTTPYLIGVKTLGDSEKGYAVNPPPELNELGQVAAADLVLDADGKLRRGLLFVQAPNGEVVTSFAMSLAFIYLDAEGVIPKNSEVNPDYLQLEEAVFVRLRSNDGGYVGINADGYQILMNYRGPRETFQTVSMADIIDGKIPADFLRDRIVLIGATAYSLPDLFNTPYNTSLLTTGKGTPGVEVHANLASQIISAALDGRPLIQSWSERTEWLWLFASSVVGVILARFSPSPLWTAGGVLLGIAVIYGTGYTALIKGWWIPVIPPVLGLTGSAVAITGYLVNLERKERKTVMDIFGRHVTPKIAEAIWHERHDLLEEGELLGQEMTATVLFTDLKGFSTLAEAMEPKTLMSFLNEYMQAMAQVVLDNDGIIDKFIGDAVMAAFGVPISASSEEAIATDAEAAVRCAVQMAAKLKSLNERWAREGRATLSMRVGIATGKLVAGCLGGSVRQDYTIIGDTVNVAARLESYDKSLDGGICRILISEETRRYTEGKFVTKAIGSVLLKGRRQATPIYQVSTDEEWGIGNGG